MLLPTAIQQALDLTLEHTLAAPELALNLALDLDDQLQDLGWRTPLTLSARGTATPDWLSKTAKDQDSPAPSSTLHKADQLARDNKGQQAIALGFNQACGREIPALNLLYANHALEVEGLWLRFLNKYLAYFTKGDEPASEGPYQLQLLPGAGNSRFQRLQAANQSSLRQHKTGPLISVLMPVHNAEATLLQAARSILEQTWQPLELLLIDDASTDNSLAIAETLKQEDSRVRVISLSTNAGPYVAKNTGLEHARGDFITVHDADDWAFPTRLADQVLSLLSDASGRLRVSIGRMLRLQEDGRITRFRPLDWISDDGALRLCFPSLLFERHYFQQQLGAWDSVRVGADTELLERVRRFAPNALFVTERPVMLQLDAVDSLTSAEATYCDERGVAPVRRDYQEAWEAWHASQSRLPRLGFPLAKRPFKAPNAILSLS